MTTPADPPWYASLPAPRTTAASISREDVLALLQAGGAGRKIVLVDVRRMDFEGGTISTSLNLPAQSLYPSLPVLYSIFAAAKIKKVIWYCGSSNGRGPRAAGWFADVIAEKGDTVMQSLVLKGGIKGWVKAGEEYTKLVEGFVEGAWDA